MTATLIDTDTFVFADGNAGHVCDLGSSPSPGQWDVLCVNSNTVVTTPSGFSAAPTHVDGQGAYIYRREAVGGEGSTVTITTAGDHNTSAIWSRWGNVEAADDAAATAAAISGTSTPAHTTNPLTETDELVIAFGALHGLGGVAPTAPSWSAGYTPLAATLQGSGGSGVVGYVAYRLDAGTAAETPQVTWTNAAIDRYMLTLTFTTSSAGQSIAVNPATETDTAGAVAHAKARALGVTTDTSAARPITRARIYTIAAANEADSAGAVTGRHARILGVAGTTDTAGALTIAHARTLGVAGETDGVGSVALARTLGIAAELDSAPTITLGGVAANPPSRRVVVLAGARRVAVLTGARAVAVVSDG